MSEARKVNAANYIKEWRKTPKGQASLRENQRREAAKRAAVKDLIAAHPMEYQILLDKHLKASS